MIYIFIDLENNTVELQEEIKRADPVSALFFALESGILHLSCIYLLKLIF